MAELLKWEVPGVTSVRVPNDETTPEPGTLIEPPSDVFDLRDSNYLKDKKKTKARPPMFDFIDLKPFSHTKIITHAAHHLKPLRDFLEAHPTREFLIVNRMLPTSPVLNVITLFVRSAADEPVDTPFELALKRFKEGDDDFKNVRFKYIVKIPNAPFALRMAVSTLGGFRPVIMGKGYLQQAHFSGANYIEVDVDVGSSRVARGIMNVVVPQMKKLIVDEAFLIEGQLIEELPERLMGISRGTKYDFKDRAIAVLDDMLIE